MHHMDIQLDSFPIKRYLNRLYEGAKEQWKILNLTRAIFNLILVFWNTVGNATVIISTIVNAKTKIDTIFFNAVIPILIIFFVWTLGANFITATKAATRTFSITWAVLITWYSFLVHETLMNYSRDMQTVSFLAHCEMHALSFEQLLIQATVSSKQTSRQTRFKS